MKEKEGGKEMSKKNNKVTVTLKFEVTDAGAFSAGKGSAVSALQTFLNASDLASVGLALRSQKISD